MSRSKAHTVLGAPERSAVVISAEHAGTDVPPELRDLGIGSDELQRHIGHDIGAEGVVRQLHSISGCPAILSRYSRLVADVNRAEDSPECVIEASDGTLIPANACLTTRARQDRIDRFYRPFRTAFELLISKTQPNCILSVHSFTRALRTDGRLRPWHCGILYRPADKAIATRCIRHLQAVTGVAVGDNQPYGFDSRKLPAPQRHNGSPVPTIVVEIRQDLIAGPEGQHVWASTLGDLIESCLAGQDARDRNAA